MNKRPRKPSTEQSKNIGELPRKPTAGSWLEDLVALKEMGAKLVDITTAMGAIEELVAFTKIVVMSDLDDVSACQELKARSFTIASTQLIEGLFVKSEDDIKSAAVDAAREALLKARKESQAVEKALRKTSASKGTRYR